MKRNKGREFQSRMIRGEIQAHLDKLNRSEIKNRFRREFGQEAVLEFHRASKKDEQVQIREFLNKAQENL